MNLGRQSIPNNGVKYIHPITAIEVTAGEEVYLQWLENGVATADVFTAADVDDITALLTIESASADIRVGVQAGDNSLQTQPAIVSTADVTPYSADAFINLFKFTLDEVDYVATITDDEIAVELPALTDPETLTPTITISNGATIDPIAEETDFTAPVVYTVTAGDGVTEKEYTVTVTIAA